MCLPTDLVTRWAYRARQFFTALAGRVRKDEMAEARQVLGDGLFAVFAIMPRQYMRHALNVYRRASDAGCEDLDVLQAALLHDSGKYDPASGRYVTVGHRVAVVLLGGVPVGRRLLAAVSRRRGARGLGGWILYPFYLSRYHARLGAELAARRGASDEVIRLIERHQDDGGEDDKLRVLQAADDRE